MTTADCAFFNDDGKLHRDPAEGPAFVKGDVQAYMSDGKLHNPYGPALIAHGGNAKEWWLNGKRHCMTGPAVRYIRGFTLQWKEPLKDGETEKDRINRFDSVRGIDADVWYVDGEHVYKPDYALAVAAHANSRIGAKTKRAHHE